MMQSPVLIMLPARLMQIDMNPPEYQYEGDASLDYI
jgi:hypothetical protein